MDINQFKEATTSAIIEIAEYYDTLENRRVSSTVEPGYLKKTLPDGPPLTGEPWAEIQKDIESKIMPGITHWQSPNFMGYFPASSSYPGILGELYSAALTTPAFNWACSPAITELETIVLDWLAKLLNLPKCFFSNSYGGGVIQGSASEAVLSVMIAAREKYLTQRIQQIPSSQREEQVNHIRSKLVALGSDTTHSSTEKAAKIAGVRYIPIPVTSEDDYALTGSKLAKTLSECKAKGLEPFFLTVTLGTTSTCAVDDFESISSTLKTFAPADLPEEIWVHVDAAYAGAALVCPEFQHFTVCFSSFHSFNVNMHKWLLTNFDASCLFVRQRNDLIDAMNISPSYLQNKDSESGKVFDYRNWQIPLGRRFRSLKIWFVLRSYGVTGLQEHIRKHIKFGEYFAGLIKTRPDLFKIISGPSFALTVFTVVSTIENNNKLTKDVFNTVLERGEIFLSSCVLDDIFMIRLVSANPLAEKKFLKKAFDILVETIEELKKEELAS